MIPAYDPHISDGYVVEFFMPKRLAYASETYALLREELEYSKIKLTSRPFLKGFSIYEVDGAFLDDEIGIMEDRILVIRVFFEQDKVEIQSPSEEFRLRRAAQDIRHYGRVGEALQRKRGTTLDFSPQ